MFICPISKLPNTGQNRRTKQKRIRNNFTVASRDFNTSFPRKDRTIKQSLSIVMDDLNNTNHQLKLINIYRKLLKRGYTF